MRGVAVQPQVDVVVQDFKGNPVAVHGLEGSLSKGAKGNKKAITFVSKGKGSYQASLSGLDIGLGTYECVSTPLYMDHQHDTLPVHV